MYSRVISMATREDEMKLLERVAWQYYKEKLIQQDIAELIHITRQRVIKLLKEAKRLRVVEIDINSP